MRVCVRVCVCVCVQRTVCGYIGLCVSVSTCVLVLSQVCSMNKRTLALNLTHRNDVFQRVPNSPQIEETQRQNSGQRPLVTIKTFKIKI